MSRHQTVYCGPYAVFHCPRKTEPEEVMKCEYLCENLTSWRYRELGSPRFCGKCGTPFITSTREVEVRPDVYSIVGDEERVSDFFQDSSNRTLYVGPNEPGPGCYLEGDSALLDIESVDIEGEKARFSVQFKTDLAKLSAEYGEAEIRWGIVVRNS